MASRAVAGDEAASSSAMDRSAMTGDVAEVTMSSTTGRYVCAARGGLYFWVRFQRGVFNALSAFNA